MDEITLELSAVLDDLHRATDFAREICESIKNREIEKDFVNLVELAVSEAFTNIIKHSGDADAGGKVLLCFQVFQDRLVTILKNRGKNFNINNVLQPDFESHPENGYGIYIINSIMDKIDLLNENDWHVLSMTKYFKTAARQFMNILVVDDDPDIRQLLQRHLGNQGFEVITAGDGREALEILLNTDVRLVITDWMMPEMDGAALCNSIRSASLSGYVYVIFLTARTKKEDIIKGMEAGADDYLIKPFNAEELKARVNAGRRILLLEHSLIAKNEIIRRDLIGAKKLQESYLPGSLPEVPSIEFASRFIPSTYVSGDMFNIFRLDEKHIGIYHLDVMGHGVLSALFSFSINQRLSHDLYPFGLLKIPEDTPPFYKINQPIDVVRILNEENLLDDLGSYFTLLYAILNTETGVLSICRAGHNLPLVIRADGSSEYLEGGGPPIGLGIPFEGNENQEIQLFPGDSFIVFSDGINECNPLDQPNVEFGLERAKNLLAANRALSMDEAFEKLIEDLIAFRGAETFNDDVSIIGYKQMEISVQT